jgi:hypothetical protein
VPGRTGRRTLQRSFLWVLAADLSRLRILDTFLPERHHGSIVRLHLALGLCGLRVSMNAMAPGAGSTTSKAHGGRQVTSPHSFVYLHTAPSWQSWG